MHALKKYLCSSVFIGGSLFFLGCEADDDGPSASDRQDQLLRDPFNYGPDADMMNPQPRDEVDPTDISGGSTSNLNKKALQRDLDAVFNP